MTMPKRVNSTLCFDMVSFVVLRREEGHAAQTWLKSVASHKDRLDMESKIPESVFVHMLLSQLTRNERMNSIDMVDDPSGVIALTWEKASQAVAGLAQANHVLFSTDMCSSQSLACHPFKAVMAKPSEEGKAAAKAGSALAPQAKMEVQSPQNAKNEAKMSSKTSSTMRKTSSKQCARGGAWPECLASSLSRGIAGGGTNVLSRMTPDMPKNTTPKIGKMNATRCTWRPELKRPSAKRMKRNPNQ